MRQLAPSGTPITMNELSPWLRTIFSQETTMQQFTAAICHYFGVKHCYFLSTGRAAMVLMLQSMAELANHRKRTVIIPSYTCFSVPSSIIKAGLEIKVCDVDPHTLDYDFQQLTRMNFSNVLAIISANLYGIPNNLDLLERIAGENDIFFIDDAAQCMGGKTTENRLAGTYGDAGLFSLDKGKAITSMNGGIIVTNSSRIASSIRSTINNTPSPSAAWCATEMAKMLVYSVFLHPALYWIPARLPFLKLGATEYTTDYPVQKYNKLLGGMAYPLFKNIDEINRIRFGKGEYYRKKLSNTPKLKHVEIKRGSCPAYLRYPILVADKKQREKLIHALQNKGLGATLSFPSSIVDIEQIKQKLPPELNHARGGKIIASQIITLPTHPFVTRSDQDNILSLITKTVQ